MGGAVPASNREKVMASINTMDGNSLTQGLQGCDVCDEAIRMAQRMADERGDDVHLVDDDGEWIVHPSRDGHRAPATAIDPVAPSDEQ